MADDKKDVLLSVDDLTVEYRTEDGVVHAVNDLSLQLSKGETLGLVGETGAGKTTLAKSIMRILPDPPAKVCGGSIKYEGEDLLSLPEKQMRKIRGKQISMIFQDPMTALNPTITVGKQIADVFRLHENLSRADATVKAVDMMETVGIEGDRYNEYPHQFSGGMKQRIVIAMALACRPQLLLSDEATTALDVTIQAQVLEMMTALKEELQTSVIMITHDLGIVAETCDTVAVVYAGEIMEYGTVFQVFDNPKHPYTLGLFGSLPTLSTTSKRLSPIPGLMPDPTNLPSGCKFSDRCQYCVESCLTQHPEMQEIEDGHMSRCPVVLEKEG